MWSLASQAKRVQSSDHDRPEPFPRFRGRRHHRAMAQIRRLMAMGVDVIHSVVNPIPRISGAIHVYGGDFYAVERSAWDPESLQEQRFDMEATQRLFAR
jgi:predicted metal-dependent enzyme (double-stranded beta helix superfamily)